MPKMPKRRPIPSPRKRPRPRNGEMRPHLNAISNCVGNACNAMADTLCRIAGGCVPKADDALNENGADSNKPSAPLEP